MFLMSMFLSLPLSLISKQIFGWRLKKLDRTLRRGRVTITVCMTSLEHRVRGWRN